jgi:hypothetical protein
MMIRCSSVDGRRTSQIGTLRHPDKLRVSDAMTTTARGLLGSCFGIYASMQCTATEHTLVSTTHLHVTTGAILERSAATFSCTVAGPPASHASSTASSRSLHGVCTN